MNFLKYRRGRMFSIVALFLIIFSLCACGESTPEYIASPATVEVGKSFTPEDFILSGEHTAQFGDSFAKYVKDGVAVIDKVGKVTVPLIVDGKTYKVKLTVKDSVAPKGTDAMAVVGIGGSIKAEKCVTNIVDKSKVTCAFKQKPDLSQPGTVNAVVILTDGSKNRTEVPVTITVLPEGKYLADRYTIEAGSEIPSADDLAVGDKPAKYLTDVSAIYTALVGEYPLELEIDGATHTTTLVIRDTVAPTGVVSNTTIYYGGRFPAANTFVSGIVDQGPVTVSFAENPGDRVTNQTSVRIVLTDQGGNRTTYTVPCTIINDNEAPKITVFPKEIVADIGTAISWRALVEATDDSGIVELTLDTSAVKMNKPGTYTAVLLANDPADNITRQEIKIVLHDNSVTQEMLNEVCKGIVDKIIKDGMTTKQQLYAVYQYVKGNIIYNGASPHDDLRREAYLSLTTRPSGDCFAFCAASNALLNYLGYETQIVRRDIALASVSGNHFWVLVNCGTKEDPQWYHHDACPRRQPYRQPTYMATDAQLRAMTKYIVAMGGKKNYFTFDTSLHPASATKIMVDLGIDSSYYD